LSRRQSCGKHDKEIEMKTTLLKVGAALFAMSLLVAGCGGGGGGSASSGGGTPTKPDPTNPDPNPTDPNPTNPDPDTGIKPPNGQGVAYYVSPATGDFPPTPPMLSSN